MKTILLLRHGKSDWGAPASDPERPLAGRGRKAAARMGRFLAASGHVPDLVVTSPARRARDTAARAASAGGWQALVLVDEVLYESSPREVLDVIRGQDDHHERILLVGHEPTWSSLAADLCGGGRLRFPTAALARIDPGTERWADVQPGSGELVWLVTPRLLAGKG